MGFLQELIRLAVGEVPREAAFRAGAGDKIHRLAGLRMGEPVFLHDRVALHAQPPMNLVAFARTVGEQGNVRESAAGRACATARSSGMPCAGMQAAEQITTASPEYSLASKIHL